MNDTEKVRLLTKHEDKTVTLLLVPPGTSIPNLERNRCVRVVGILHYILEDTWSVEAEGISVCIVVSDVTLTSITQNGLSLVAMWGHKEVKAK